MGFVNYSDLVLDVDAALSAVPPHKYVTEMLMGAGAGGDGEHELGRIASEVPEIPNNPSFPPTPAPAPGGGAAGGGAGGVGAYVAKFHNINVNVKDMSVHEIAELLKDDKSLRTAAENIAAKQQKISHSPGSKSGRLMKKRKKRVFVPEYKKDEKYWRLRNLNTLQVRECRARKKAEKEKKGGSKVTS